jgi:hypothetical protein
MCGVALGESNARLAQQRLEHRGIDLVWCDA